MPAILVTPRAVQQQIPDRVNFQAGSCVARSRSDAPERSHPRVAGHAAKRLVSGSNMVRTIQTVPHSFNGKAGTLRRRAERS